jgi:hypothetical protein
MIVEVLPGAGERHRGAGVQHSPARRRQPAHRARAGGALQHFCRARSRWETRPLRYRCAAAEQLRQRLIVLSADDREHLRHETDDRKRSACSAADHRFTAGELRPD